jgi:O-glycosyl hydrolase
VAPLTSAVARGCLAVGLAAALMLTWDIRSRGQQQAEEPSVTQSPAADALAVRVQIDLNREHQRIEGFGATVRSAVHDGRDVLGPELRARALEALHSEVRLSVGNLDVALLESPGTYAERRNDNDDPKSINWSGFQTAGADAMKRFVLDQPEAAAFRGYFLAQRINTRWASPWLAELRSRNYGRYIDEAVEQIVAGQTYWRDKHGVAPRFHQLFNEPLTGNRELAGGDRVDLADIVKKAGQRLRQLGFADVRFVVANESDVLNAFRSAEAILSDRGARQFVGAIGYHPYGNDGIWSARLLDVASRGEPDPKAIESRTRLRELGARYGVQLWMCETSSNGAGLNFPMFRARAIHIRHELVYANASVYQGMNSIWDLESHLEHFRKADGFTSDGNIVQVDQQKKTVKIGSIGYAMGHYARWLTPGAAVRIESSTSDPLVMAAAFRDHGGKRLVTVLMNNANAPRTVALDAGDARVSGPMTGEQSTENAYWSPLGPVPLTGEPPRVVLPPLSVTTVAIPLAESTASVRH